MGKVVRRVCLINDFVAVGYGLTCLNSSEVVTLHEDQPREHGGVIGCVGAGTGLGEVYLTWDQTKGEYRSHPSEGGMTEFLARTDQEWRLRKWLLKQEYPGLGGHVTVESVVSGPGLANCYEFLLSERSQDDDALTKVERCSGTVGAVAAEVSTRALESNPDPICLEAVDLMLKCFAAELRQVG